MAMSLTNPEKRELKARAQRLDPLLRLGHAGATEAFLKSLDEALDLHQLVKVRFAEFKEQKKARAPELAEKTRSELIMRVGNVAVYFRAANAEN
jgi:RNA-binding protein